MLLNLMLPFNNRRNGQTFVSPPAKPGLYLSESGTIFLGASRYRLIGALLQALRDVTTLALV